MRGHGRSTPPRCKVRGGREELRPLPKDVEEAVDHYLRLDRKRREVVRRVGLTYRQVQMMSKRRDPKTVM